ncbi:MAG TPA: hypothetical protein VF691_04190 [Cytophagaceae bacterium]|jgi:hypothetical protein
MEQETESFAVESQFEDFYKRNISGIKRTLKGRKMKKRHLKHAKALLDESTRLPEAVKENIILDGIEETVTESDQESFDGENFDHFAFANKIKKKAVAIRNRKVNASRKRILPRMRRKPVPSKAIENGELGSPAKAAANISPPPSASSSSSAERADSSPLEMEANDTPEQSPLIEAHKSPGTNVQGLVSTPVSAKPTPNTELVTSGKSRFKIIAIGAAIVIAVAIVIVYFKRRKA